MNDPEVTRFLETRFAAQTEDGIRQYIESVLRDPAYLFLAIVLRDGDRHIGNIKMGPISRIHGSADVGLLIGEKDCWGRVMGRKDRDADRHAFSSVASAS